MRAKSEPGDDARTMIGSPESVGFHVFPMYYRVWFLGWKPLDSRGAKREEQAAMAPQDVYDGGQDKRGCQPGSP